MQTEIRIQAQRLQLSLEQMAQAGPGVAGGSNRQALTREDAAGRALFLHWCHALGGVSRLDSMGNLFVRFEGSDEDLKPILLGSHLDTQPTGGRYDGVYGVLAALEVVRSLQEAGHCLRHPLDLVVWCNEEGARFTPAMCGSGVFAGVLAEADILQVCDSQGVRFEDALIDSGQKGSIPCRAFEFAASLELHIEQGPVLEAEGIPLGVVQGVQGMNWYRITLQGDAVHAGPTPMHMRRDPVQSLYPLLADLYAMLPAYGEEARLTTGIIETLPGSTNTVPEQVSFTVDLRHPQQPQLEAMEAQLLALCDQHSGAVTVSAETLWQSPAVQFDPRCINAVAQACRQLELPAMEIVSGAGHDSVYISHAGPAGMIFVPCRGGISHNEAEFVEPEHIAAGGNVLLHALLNLDELE